MGLFDRILRRLRGAPEPARQDAPGLFTARSPRLSTRHATPPEAPAPPEDLWDRPDPAPAPEVAEPIDPAAELAAIEELAPPAAEPETPVEDAVAPEGSTADEPLFGAYGAAPEPPASEEPAPAPVPPLFDPPQVATEPEPGDVAPEVTTRAEPDPAPAAETEPHPLVVETYPEVFDAAPAGDAEPAATPTADQPVVGEEQSAAERTMRVHDERLDKRPGPIRMTPSEAIRLAQDGPRTTRRADHPEA